MLDDAQARAKQCGTKKRFLSRSEAKNELKTAARRFGEKQSKLAVYHCRWCGLWHWGHNRFYDTPVRRNDDQLAEAARLARVEQTRKAMDRMRRIEPS